MDLKILFEDKHVIVVIKPPGMPCQPDPSGAVSLLEDVQKHMVKSKEGSKTARLVHRLDRPVGGVMIYAKTQEAAGHLGAQFADGRVKKRYLAIVKGHPIEDSGHLANDLKIESGSNVVRVVPAGLGQRAELKYRVLSRGETSAEPCSLVDVLLLTGRRHQIRVQFAEFGFPIVGDAKYNPAWQAGEPLIALWSYEIRFYHPAKRTALTFKCLPDTKTAPWMDFSAQIDAL
jgi:23S rRNA pseudouridine1911/1915/1917 synthase